MKIFIAWVNAGSFTPPNGFKPSGLEYRIMREAGIVAEGSSRDPHGIGETMCRIAEALKDDFPDEVKAAWVWAKDGFRIRAVKRHFKCDTRTAHKLLDAGVYLMRGGYLSMKSISYVGDD